MNLFYCYNEEFGYFTYNSVYDYLVDSRKVNQYLLALYKVKIFQKIIRIKIRHTSKSPRIDCKKQFMQGLFL